MAFWLDIASFAIKALLIVVPIAGAIILVVRLTRGEHEDDLDIEIKSLDERYDHDEARLNFRIMPKSDRKAYAKARKKAAKKAVTPDKRVFALNFKGDINASSVGRLGARSTPC